MKLLGSFEPFEAANISASSSSREREREIERETQSEREKRKKERKRERESPSSQIFYLHKRLTYLPTYRPPPYKEYLVVINSIGIDLNRAPITNVQIVDNWLLK